MKQSSYNIAENLPESLNKQNIIELATLIDKKIHELEGQLDLITIYPNINNLPSDIVDQLAIQLHVDFYDTTLDLATRRALVKNAIRWHSKKGTKSAVTELLATVYQRAGLLEWFEYGGEPYHFKVTVDGTYKDITKKSTAMKLVNSVKNVRSWCDDIEITYSFLQDADDWHIQHSAAMMGDVAAKHVFWNHGLSEGVYWDGVYNWDSAVRWDGRDHGDGYSDRQQHKAAVYWHISAVQTKPYSSYTTNSWGASDLVWNEVSTTWDEYTVAKGDEHADSMVVHACTSQLIDANGNTKGDITNE